MESMNTIWKVKKKTSPTYDFSNVGCAIANIQMKTLGTYV
jgi:hypothetical protein